MPASRGVRVSLPHPPRAMRYRVGRSPAARLVLIGAVRTAPMFGLCINMLPGPTIVNPLVRSAESSPRRGARCCAPWSPKPTAGGCGSPRMWDT